MLSNRWASHLALSHLGITFGKNPIHFLRDQMNMKAGQLINEQFEVIVSGCDDFPASSSHNRLIANLRRS